MIAKRTTINGLFIGCQMVSCIGVGALITVLWSISVLSADFHSESLSKNLSSAGGYGPRLPRGDKFSGILLRVTTISAQLVVSTYQTRKQFKDFKMSKVLIPILTTEKSYKQYKTELNCWLKLITLEKSKRGLAVASSLPDSLLSKIKDIVFTQLAVEELSADKRIEESIKLFDKHLGKVSSSDAFDKFNDFKHFTRTTESINEFISEFDNRYQRWKNWASNFRLKFWHLNC